MKKLIKFGLGTLVAAVTFSAGANSFEDATKRTAVWAKGHWDVPSNERLAYAQKLTTAVFPGETYFVEPDNAFDLAFGVEHALPMSENGTDFNVVLDYDQYSTNQKDVKSGATFSSILGLAGIGPAADVSREANIQLRDRTWRLGVQRAKEFGRFDWRLGAFAEYSKLARTYNLLERSVAEGRQLFTKQESDGWGPSFDIMGRFYPWGRDTGFSVFGGGETAFLYSDQGLSVVSSTNGNRLPDNENQNRTDLNAVMTRLGASVGVGYARPISEDVMVGFKVGGRWMSYYNAFKNSSDLTTGRTDYDRVGPFLELRVGGTHSPM
ncbi:MAG: Lpg1974 family pore-forming outer membrane protein [Gammaproteobacteria bacterium]